MSYRDDEPRRPRAEPEILPPEPRDGMRRGGGTDRVWVTRHRVVITPPGPLGVLAALLGIAVIAAAGVLTVLGLFLLWLPLMVIGAGAILVSALLRGPRR